MEKIDRAIQRSEEKFFEECDPGNSELDSLWLLELMIPSVPVVVLFTKFDALRPLAMAKMTPADLKLPLRERLSKAKPLTEEVFGEANIWGRLCKMTYPPKSSIRIERESHVSLYLPDYIIHYKLGMHKSNEGSNKLLEVTAAVLSEETLQMLLVSAQETNLALCVKYATREYVLIRFLYPEWSNTYHLSKA